MITIISPQNIPKALIYEELDGLTIYYAGYKTVLNDLENIGSIMGSGGLQSVVIEIIKDYLKINLGKKYRFLSNEVGLHIGKNNNLCADIAIFLKSKLPFNNLEDKYITTPPEVVIEIDTKADFTNIRPADYFNIKTEKLFSFGVKQVVWVYTNSKKIMVAVPKKPWLTIDWDTEIEVLGEKLNVLELMKKEGYEDEKAF